MLSRRSGRSERLALPSQLRCARACGTSRLFVPFDSCCFGPRGACVLACFACLDFLASFSCLACSDCFACVTCGASLACYACSACFACVACFARFAGFACFAGYARFCLLCLIACVLPLLPLLPCFVCFFAESLACLLAGMSCMQAHTLFLFVEFFSSWIPFSLFAGTCFWRRACVCVCVRACVRLQSSLGSGRDSLCP